MAVNKRTEKLIWQEQFDEVLRKENPTQLEEFFNILSIVMTNEFNSSLSVLFKLLGLDKFIEVVTTLSGYELQIPDRQDFIDALVLALVKYYRDVKHLSWEETKKQVQFDAFAPIRIGRRLSNLDKNIQKQLLEVLEKENEKENEQEGKNNE